MTDRKTLLTFLQSWPVRDTEDDLPRRYEPACDLLRDPNAKARVDRSLKAESWSAAFAALLLHGFHLEGPQAERAIDQLREDQVHLGEELPELASIVRLYDALASDRRTLRKGGKATLKPKFVFEVAEENQTPGATLVRGLFIHRYEALTVVVERHEKRIAELESDIEALKSHRERVSPKQVNALQVLLYLVAKRQLLKPSTAAPRPLTSADEALASWLVAESDAARADLGSEPPARFDAIKKHVASGRRLLAEKKSRPCKGE